MQADLSSLPDDIGELKKIIHSFSLDLEKNQETIIYLEERIRLLQNELFGRKSEKHDPGYDRQLTVYIEDSRLKPDDNAAENAIRPFVLGRKNWLFCCTRT